MKVHTTNYFNTLITVAADCKVRKGSVPPERSTKTVADYQYEMLSDMPFKYTSDEVLFEVFALKNQIAADDYEVAQQDFFSKGQPCMRCSPLPKTYGWGVYHNEDGKVKLVDCGSEEYQELCENKNIKKVMAMRSSRK